jgi:hypothetical protein
MLKARAIMTRFSWLAAGCLLTAITGPATAADTPAYGGNGGGQFRGYCPRGDFLVGLGGRTGRWVDSILPICRHWDTKTKSSGPQTQGSAAGGSGGGPQSVACPPAAGVHGVQIYAVNNDGQVLVQEIVIFCQAIEKEVSNKTIVGTGAFGNNQPSDGSNSQSYSCPDGEMADGIYGHAGAYLDSVGLSCAPAPMDIGRPLPTPGVTHLGRVNVLGFKLPKIKAANGQTVMLDFCRDYGAACGKPAADAFCQQNGHPAASSFLISKNVGQTAIISSGALCTNRTCDGFANIECHP